MKQEIKNAILGKRFWGACALMMVCLLGLSVPEWISSISWGSEYRQSALQQSISGAFFGGVMLLLPFCACLPYAVNQVDELCSSVANWKLIRSSTKKYAMNKIIAAGMSGGASIILAFILHSVVWNIIALPCDPGMYPYHQISFHPDSLYAIWYQIMYGLPMYLSIATGMFISGFVWAVVALSVSVWVPDRLLTITIPTCIYYLISANILQPILGWQLPHPATLYNDALTVESALESIFEYFIIFTLASIIYMHGLKRREQDA